MQYPHPVLSEANKDFINSSFQTELMSLDEKDRDNLALKIKYNLICNGLKNLIDLGDALVIARITCKRTSYRDYLILDKEEGTILKIPKRKISDDVEIEPWILAANKIDNYQLEEFNRDYFSGLKFQIQKGTILATAPGYKIRLDSFVEKALKGIVNIVPSSDITSLKVCYAKNGCEDAGLSDYITIFLPLEEGQRYIKLKGNRFNQNNLEKFLQCSLVLPAIAGGVELLYKEEQTEEEEYRGTIWAESIYSALQKKGYNEIRDYLDENINPCPSVFELVNILYGNIEGDALNQLQQKVEEWSALPEEREDL